MSGTWATFKHTNLCQYTTEMSNTTTKRSTFKKLFKNTRKRAIGQALNSQPEKQV
jgi:hypothetical protein